MVLLVRIILIGLIVYLLMRSFARFFEDEKRPSGRNVDEEKGRKKNQGVSKEVGEYIDYEEVND
jgi:hypothetical protein